MPSLPLFRLTPWVLCPAMDDPPEGGCLLLPYTRTCGPLPTPFYPELQHVGVPPAKLTLVDQGFMPSPGLAGVLVCVSFLCCLGCRLPWGYPGHPWLPTVCHDTPFPPHLCPVRLSAPSLALPGTVAACSSSCVLTEASADRLWICTIVARPLLHRVWWPNALPLLCGALLSCWVGPRGSAMAPNPLAPPPPPGVPPVPLLPCPWFVSGFWPGCRVRQSLPRAERTGVRLGTLTMTMTKKGMSAGGGALFMGLTGNALPLFWRLRMGLTELCWGENTR